MASIIKIDRSLWLRGEEATKNPVLYDKETKKYDFLGKLLNTVGYEWGHIVNFRWPSQVVNKYHGTREAPPRSIQWLVSKAHADTAEAIKIAALNDDPSITDQVREREITRVVTEFGSGYHLVEFFDPAPTKQEIWDVPIKPTKKDILEGRITWDTVERGWRAVNV